MHVLRENGFWKFWHFFSFSDSLFYFSFLFFFLDNFTLSFFCSFGGEEGRDGDLWSERAGMIWGEMLIPMICYQLFLCIRSGTFRQLAGQAGWQLVYLVGRMRL